MDKDQVATILDEIGILLELQGENPFRCGAYYKAARAISQLETNLGDIVAAGTLHEIRGIGSTLKEKITILVTTGKLHFYEELRTKTPPGLLQLLRLPGVGPKKVKAMFELLGIDTLAKLKSACETDQVSELKGFGKKTQEKILEGIALLDELGQRVRLDQALDLAEMLLSGLRKVKGIQRLEPCGSLRRRKEIVRDIDILISSSDAAPIMAAFVKLPYVMRIVGQGETKCSVVAALPQASGPRILMNADLRVVSDEQFPFALNYFTGSKEHNIAMRQRAIQYGLKLNEYELVGPKKKVAAKDEADIYRALDLDFVVPELREDTGELAAAEAH